MCRQAALSRAFAAVARGTSAIMITIPVIVVPRHHHDNACLKLFSQRGRTRTLQYSIDLSVHVVSEPAHIAVSYCERAY